MKKIKKPWIIVATLVILAIAFFGIKSYMERPQDLGTELEYIGTTTSGCWFICDSRPASEYYYATNLTQEELKGYFKGASYVEHPNIGGGGSGSYNYKYLFFKPKDKPKEFLISYYDNTQAVIELKDLKQTNKQFVISMAASDYQVVRTSLE